MFEQQISRLRRSLGREESQPASRWLAPVAIVVAGMTGALALVASRLRRPKPAPASKSRSRRSSTGEARAESPKPRTRRVTKGSSSDGASSRRGTTAAGTPKETSTSTSTNKPTSTGTPAS